MKITSLSVSLGGVSRGSTARSLKREAKPSPGGFAGSRRLSCFANPWKNIAHASQLQFSRNSITLWIWSFNKISTKLITVKLKMFEDILDKILPLCWNANDDASCAGDDKVMLFTWSREYPTQMNSRVLSKMPWLFEDWDYFALYASVRCLRCEHWRLIWLFYLLRGRASKPYSRLCPPQRPTVWVLEWSPADFANFWTNSNV